MRNGYGVSHADELLQMFVMDHLSHPMGSGPISDLDRTASEAIMKSWIEFARSGSPSISPGDSDAQFHWIPSTEDQPRYQPGTIILSVMFVFINVSFLCFEVSLRLPADSRWSQTTDFGEPFAFCKTSQLPWARVTTSYRPAKLKPSRCRTKEVLIKMNSEKEKS